MVDLYLVNTLTRKKEKFVPLHDKKVGIYSCGPTVYWNQHIGHMYAYVQWDILSRLLKYVGFEVDWIMNITDVGHMTSDEDTGEDKLEKGAKREGLNVWDLAEKYTRQFVESLELLNIQKPRLLPRATAHIEEQIDLIKKIESKGFTYKTKMGLVFDTGKFPDYAKFGNLQLDKTKSREDVEIDPEKKSPSDFFLWVTGNPAHIMQWDSPWGKGYPGWHIECTAMSTKYLGEKFDIHTGGIEHIPVHHTNEIAQGYAAFGRQTANFWLHNAHLLGKGGVKMSKSLGNFITVQELIKEGYNPLALRYLFLTSHYRKGLNFSTDALDASQIALEKLQNHMHTFKSETERTTLSPEKDTQIEEYREKFLRALADDLNTPEALAATWEVVKSNIPGPDKFDLLTSFDEVLGLNLSREREVREVPGEIRKLMEKREALRKAGKYEEADEVRKEIEAKGYDLEDTPLGPKIK